MIVSNFTHQWQHLEITFFAINLPLHCMVSVMQLCHLVQHQRLPPELLLLPFDCQSGDKIANCWTKYLCTVYVTPFAWQQMVMTYHGFSMWLLSSSWKQCSKEDMKKLWCLLAICSFVGFLKFFFHVSVGLVLSDIYSLCNNHYCKCCPPVAFLQCFHPCAYG